MVTIAMSMISGKLGEDKQNKQEKSETAVRESIGVVPLALPLMAGRGQSVQLSSGGPGTTLGASGRVLTGDSGICPLLLGDFPYGAVAGPFAGADGNQRHHPYYGPVADGPRH